MNRFLETLLVLFCTAVLVAGGAQQQEQKGDTATGSAMELQPLNSDTEPDRIEWWQLEQKFGSIPPLKSGLRVAAVSKTLTNEYWRLLAEGYESFAEQHGITVKVSAAGNEASPLDQLNIAETMIADQYDVLLASPQTDANLFPAFQKAKKIGLPFVNVNDAVLSQAEQYIGNVQKDNGVRAAKWFIANYPDGGKLAVIEGQPGVYAARQRTEGFKETLAGHSQFEVVASIAANWDRQLAYDQATTILLKNDDLLGFYANNDTMALGIVEAVKAQKKLAQVKVIGTDGISTAYESINKGELTATVDSFPVLTGIVAMEVAVRLLSGQDLPRVVATPQALITKENYPRYKGIDIETLKQHLVEDASK